MSQQQENDSGNTITTLSTAWHHAPLHRLNEQGIYMVTAGTLGKDMMHIEPKP